MAPSTSHLDQAQPYTGHDKVVFGNGNILPISHIGTENISPNISLKDILVVPNLSKKLPSIGKLTNDYPIYVLFSCQSFTIQDRMTGKILGKSRLGMRIWPKKPNRTEIRPE